jgi:hypothetical protein
MNIIGWADTKIFPAVVVKDGWNASTLPTSVDVIKQQPISPKLQ